MAPIQGNLIEDDLVSPVEELPTLPFALEAIGRKWDKREPTERNPLCTKLNVGILVGLAEIAPPKE